MKVITMHDYGVNPESRDSETHINPTEIAYWCNDGDATNVHLKSGSYLQVSETIDEIDKLFEQAYE